MIDAGRLFGRGIAFPPRLGPEGRLLWSEGPQNIRESIRIILMTELQERLMRPEFGAGLRAFLFEPNTVTTHRLIEDRARRALERWEPRIRIEAVTVAYDPDDAQAALVTIQYQLVATAATDSAVLSVQLAG